MNKYRILTSDNKWVYTQINVMDDCIRCPLMDEDGKQILNPTIKLRPETFGVGICPCENDLFIYPGDIFKGLYWKTNEKLWGIIKSDPEGVDGAYSQFSWWASIHHPFIGETGRKWRIDDLSEIRYFEIIGNKWQNPELLKDKVMFAKLYLLYETLTFEANEEDEYPHHRQYLFKEAENVLKVIKKLEDKE